MKVWKSPIAMWIFAIFAFFIWPLIAFDLFTEDEAWQAKQRAAADQQELKQLTINPFKSATLDSVEVTEPGDATGTMADITHAIYLHPCAILEIHRTVVATRKAQVIIPRKFDGGDYFPMLPGAEILSPGVNYMAPRIQVPSNLRRYTYESYDSGMAELGHYYSPIQFPNFRIFVIDVGYPLPKFVQGKPFTVPLPPSNPPPQPSCPALSTVAPASPAP